MDRSDVRRTAVVMGFVAVTLFVSSAVHHLGDAGIPEAIIGVVLVSAAAVMTQEPWRARAVGLAAVGFAIAGFGVGLTVTAERGSALEVAYHVVMLPILIGTFISLLRRSPRREDSSSLRSGARLLRRT